MSEEQLLRYVREAIAIQDSGQTLDLQELCSDAPELIEAVGETLALDSLVTSSSADGLVGQTLNERYTLRRCIGIGAMGTVYEADDLSLHRVVAVKLLPPGTFVEQRRRDRFRREAQVLAALNHPNIVSVYDHGRTEHGLHYLVMERLQGSSMASLVNPQHTSAPPSRPRIGWLAGELGLPVQSEDYIPQVVIWMLEVIEALHAAHTAGICHRDVKPSNVFLTRDGRAVLLDFGIAARSGDASMTTRGSALGTPAYMAPEQVARDGEASPTMDAYGVCATLYHLVSMQPPYTGDSLEVLAKLTCEDPRPLKSIDPRLPTDLCAIIEKGLERSAGRRYRDMSELGADLRAFLAHMPVQARPITRLARAFRHVRRRPAYLVAGIAITGIALSISLPAAWSQAEARAKTDHARLFAATAPSLAVEGSVERRLRMDRNERAGYIGRLDAILAIAPGDVFSRMLRSALHQDQANGPAAAEDVATIVGAPESDYLREIVSRYRAVPTASAGIGALELTNLPEPTTGLGRFIAGFHRRRLADFDGADEVLAAAPEFLPARYLRIGVRLAQALPERDIAAREQMLRWISHEATVLQEELPGPTARTFYCRGSALLHLGDYEAAAIDLQRSHELQPGSFGTLNNLGLVYRRLLRFEDAERALLAASKLRPWNLNAQLQLIDLLSATARFQEATSRLDDLGKGDLITAVDRLIVRCDLETDRYLFWKGAGQHQQMVEAARSMIELCEQGKSLVAADDDDTRTAFEQRALLARLALNNDAEHLLWVLDVLATRPFDHIHLSALAELLDHPELETDDLASEVLNRIRTILRAQAEQVASQRK